MIDTNDTVKIIDFGSTFIAGVTDANTEEIMRGTMRYSAPEYFLGHLGTQTSDLYSLAVITYQMLSGKFPYGSEIAQANSVSAQRKLSYKSILDALKVDPLKRYPVVSEFIHDLRQPNKLFLAKTKPPLIQRDPVMFWQWISLILFIIVIVQAI